MDWEEMEREAMREDKRKGHESTPAGNNGRGKRPTRTNARSAPPRKRPRGRR